MGPRETRLVEQARSFVRAGDDALTNGEPPWFYYAKASELAKGLPAARLADALEEALSLHEISLSMLESELGRPMPGARQLAAPLRAVLAEVDRG